jgi:hypothetical protein
MEPLIRYIANEKEGYTIGEMKFNIECFADDTYLVTKDQKELQSIFNKTENYLNNYGVKVNSNQNGY